MNTSSTHATLKIARVLVAGLMLATATLSAAMTPAAPDFDAMTTAIVDHASRMSAIGAHPVGSAGENRSVAYVQQAFTEAGLSVSVEPFTFKRFVLEELTFRVDGKTFPVMLMGLDPYGGQLNYAGNMVLLNPEDEEQQYKDQVVVIPGERAFFGVMYQGAKMIVCLEPHVFQQVAQLQTTDCKLNVVGHMETLTSHNVVAVLPATEPTGREILITSHLDGYRDSPGANDNGTGVGCAIELARLFSRQPDRSRTLKFVAFGGEETGLLGSRQYFIMHREELADIDLVFNVDTIGGIGDPRVEMGGGMAEAYAKLGACNFPEHLMGTAWEDVKGRWRVCHPEILQPLLMSSQTPDWLETILRQTVSNMDFNVDAARTIFSDGRMFAQGGIPVSGVAQKAGSKLIHSQDDTPANLHPDLIRKCTRISHQALCATLAHFDQ